jgi:RimJ/RimL family protein N-acetyltransferase
MLAPSKRLRYEPLSQIHASRLFPVLAAPEIYEHITGEVPITRKLFEADIAARVGGPPPSRPHERWFNVAIALRGAPLPQYIGRLEATVHGHWGEVAYLLAPKFWGLGYAKEAMQWWHEYLASAGVTELWAAVTPSNARSVFLLKKLGYQLASRSKAPGLSSYDTGDKIFHLSIQNDVSLAG